MANYGNKFFWTHVGLCRVLKTFRALADYILLIGQQFSRFLLQENQQILNRWVIYMSCVTRCDTVPAPARFQNNFRG